MRTALAALAATAMLLASFTACSPSQESSLKLSPTPPISAGPGWAVVKGAYVRLKEAPSQSAKDLAHLRRGELVEVTGRDLGGAKVAADRGIWYRFEVEGAEGWARGEELDVFAVKAQAERAAAEYR